MGPSRAHSSTNGSILVPPDGLVKLKDKKAPTIKQIANNELDPEALPLVFTRGKTDISLLKQLLSSKGDSVWAEEEHARSNAQMKRVHDDMGIKKSMFVFGDDFLQRAYSFPWFQQPEWKRALQPVFAVLGIQEDKVVRCMLASMPPGVDIPVHHDCGFWVRHTHRVHVPITTNVDEVDFFVGPDSEHMTKASFDEGRVVEFNNQSKHAVANRWSHNRVHLILDYVDDYPVDIVPLSVGAKIVQTRRSLDVEGVSVREGPNPAFIILGGHKCGSTLLYEMLNHHPYVVRGRAEETHFFDWSWPEEVAAFNQATAVDELRKSYMSFFPAEQLKMHPSLITGESTPSYLFRGDLVIPRLMKVSGQTRLVVVLTDPVKRAYSHYQMAFDPEGMSAEPQGKDGLGWKSKTFEQIIDEEEAALAKAGVGPDTSPVDFVREYLGTLPTGCRSLLGQGLYALQLQPWLEAYGSDQIKVLFLEEVTQSAQSLQEAMDGLCEHVELPPFRPEDHTQSVESLQGAMSDVLKQVGLPLFNALKNGKACPPMTEAASRRLRIFYAPYDEALRRLLGRDSFPWSSGAADGAPWI